MYDRRKRKSTMEEEDGLDEGRRWMEEVTSREMKAGTNECGEK